MKKLLLTSAAFLSLSAGALAADLPRRTFAPVPAPMPSMVIAVPTFTWTGFYAGLHAGYVWSEADARTGSELADDDIIPGSARFDNDGFMFGAQAGYNVQFGALVAGVEGDVSWTDVGGSTSGANRATFHADLDWLATLRGRLGVAFDRALFYGTAGFAFGDTSYRVDWDGGTWGSSDLQTGYAVGAGVEYAFTNNLTLKAEWLYYDLGRETVRLERDELATADYRFENNGNLARIGVNFKF
jgi:outer membrane immunogenic protein